VTIQGRVPFRRHHMSRRARLGSRARGSYSYHTRSLRRIRRGNDCGWCGRGSRGLVEVPIPIGLLLLRKTVNFVSKMTYIHDAQARGGR